jgi:hypothetical protein
VDHNYNPSYSVGRDQEIMVQTQPRQVVCETPIWKILNTHIERTARGAQVVEHLPYKHEAQISQPSTTTKKNNNKKLSKQKLNTAHLTGYKKMRPVKSDKTRHSVSYLYSYLLMRQR